MYKLEKRKIIFDIDTEFNSFESIDSSCNANVYKFKINDNYYALKIFNNPHKENENKYNRLLNINIPSFISPIKLSYIGNTFNGYLMNFCSGINLCENKLNITVNEFLNYSNILLSDTEKISNSRYLIKDIGVGNTLFDNGFKIIDLDYYKYVKKSNKIFKNTNDILTYNKKEINELLIDLFVVITGGFDKLYDSCEFKKFMDCVVTEKITFEEMVNMLCLSNKDDTDMESLGNSLIKRFGDKHV